MRLLQARGKSARGVIAGSPQFGRDEATTYTQELRRAAPTNVSFVGYCAGMQFADMLRAADIFCFPPTWSEPFGMVNVEAMATGVPVVATISGGIPEIFANGGALLVRPGSPEDLALALGDLLENACLRGRLGREGYRAFQNKYTWRCVRENYDRILTTV
jgi:spore coat protein SA